MRILMVHPHDIEAPEEPWTVRIRELAREYVQRGHEVRLVYFPLRANGPLVPNDARLGYRAIPLSRQHGTQTLRHNIRVVAEHGEWADVVHLQKCFHYAALPALWAARTTRTPLHYDWDDWEIKIYYDAPNQSRMIGAFLNLWERRLPRLADTVSYSSHRLKEECLALGVPEERMCHAHVGANLSRFRPQQNNSDVRKRYRLKQHVVLYLGQLHGGQYVDLFIRACQKIQQQRQDVSYLVVGSGHQISALQQLAHSLGLQRDMLFTGYVPHEEVSEYVEVADVCVACFEDTDITRCKSPLKIVEYLAKGKAIVASAVGEVRNMVGGAGILVPPGDAGALSQGVLTLLNDEELRRRLEASARRRAEDKYNWGCVAEKLLSMYEKSLDTSQDTAMHPSTQAILQPSEMPHL